MLFIFLFLAALLVAPLTQPKEIHFNPKGVHTITKILFQDDLKDANIHEQFCFAEGLTRFCKEKGIPQGYLIATKHNKKNKRDHCKKVTLKLEGIFFPQKAIFLNIISKVRDDGSIAKRDVIATPAMKKFIQDMIEKGKSVSQTQTSN